MAPQSIPGGSSYGNEIDSAIQECSVLVLILSENSQQSFWVPKEVSLALTYGKTVLPFHIDSSIIIKPFTFYITDVQFIEAYSRQDDAYQELYQTKIKEYYLCFFCD